LKTYPVGANLNSLYEPYNICRQDGFYELEEDSLDVIFVGSSNVHCNINPNVIWKDFGITSYDYSSDLQDLGTSYYYLERAFETQSPKVVFVDVLSDGSSDEISDFAAHLAFDHIEMDILKYEAVQARARSNREEMLFPFITYHERWKELTQDDYKYKKNRHNPLKGAFVYMVTNPQESIDLPEELPSAELSDNTKYWVKEMVELCNENQCQCVFIKTPIIENEQFYSYLNAFDDYCNENDVSFINLGYSYDEVGLDLTCDYADTNHMNYAGSVKLSDYFGKYISENYDIKDKRSDETYAIWNEDYELMEYYIENYDAFVAGESQ